MSTRIFFSFEWEEKNIYVLYIYTLYIYTHIHILHIYNLYSLLLLEVVMFILQLIIKTEQSLEIHVKISPKLNTTPRLKVCGREDITYNDVEIIMVSKGHEILKT